MTTVGTSGKYLRLEVLVWRDPSNGSIHLTSDDPDVAGKLHTYIRKHTAAHRVLDALLNKMLP